jgi:Ca2+-binding EF-hand superfamily protein
MWSFKTNINNIINSPNYYLDNDLNWIFTDFDFNDSGYIFEIILSRRLISLKKMMSDEKFEDLFNIKYLLNIIFNKILMN